MNDITMISEFCNEEFRDNLINNITHNSDKYFVENLLPELQSIDEGLKIFELINLSKANNKDINNLEDLNDAVDRLLTEYPQPKRISAVVKIIGYISAVGAWLAARKYATEWKTSIETDVKNVNDKIKQVHTKSNNGDQIPENHKKLYADGLDKNIKRKQDLQTELDDKTNKLAWANRALSTVFYGGIGVALLYLGYRLYSYVCDLIAKKIVYTRMSASDKRETIKRLIFESDKLIANTNNPNEANEIKNVKERLKAILISINDNRTE